MLQKSILVKLEQNKASQWYKHDILNEFNLNVYIIRETQSAKSK